jgi:hypothetical protein
VDLTDIYRIFHPAKYNIHPSQQSKIGHILGHQANLNKYKKIEIMSCVLFDHEEMKLGLNRRNSRKYRNT